MTTAYVFPGQGSQAPGMGAAFYETWPATRERFDQLDDSAALDLYDLCFQADQETLQTTANTQPAVYAIGVATYAGAVSRIGPPDYVAGHSLGHLTAATAGDALIPEDGIELVTRRGELMEDAAQRDGPGTMVAVLLADPADVERICGEYENVSVAGFNTPRQTVISGTTDAISAARAAIEAETRARFTELDVGAAFHSPVMASASSPFGELVDHIPFQNASIPICSDVTTEIYTDPAVARRDLTAQLTAPIDWVGVIDTLSERGVETFVEFPPAGTLVELIEKIAPETETIALKSPDIIEDVHHE
ncbi:MAG: ACP S-malonyltransferase [Halobacteriales archaeon]